MRKIGDYEKLDLIGGGSYAEVFKARNTRWDYECAIKVFKDTIKGESDKKYATFTNECKMLLKLGNGSHPNIIRIRHPHLEDGHMFYEMDLVNGVTLQKYVEETVFVPMEMVHTFIEDIGDAMAYCHHDIYKYRMNKDADDLTPDLENGDGFIISEEKKKALIRKYSVIHNDLHSGNIMLRAESNHFIILDFGLAIQEGNCVKFSGRLDGAVEYTAPEKLFPSRYRRQGTDASPGGEGLGADGSSDMPTTQADVYSLGILMYEMLTGRPPFVLRDKTSESDVWVRNAHLRTAPPSIEPLRREAFEKKHEGQSYVKDYPDWLEDIIKKCLSKQPEDRYADAKALYEDYKAHVKEDAEKAQAAYQPAQGSGVASQMSELRERVVKLSEEKEGLKADNNSLAKENARLKKKLRSIKEEAPSANGSWMSRYALYIIAALIGVAAMLSYDACHHEEPMGMQTQEQTINP